MANAASEDPERRTHTFRQSSAVISGAVVVVVAVIFLVSSLFESGPTSLAGLLWPVGAILLSWALLLRPSVRLVPQGVELHNIVRDVIVTWPAIDLVESRWALTLVTEDGRDFKSFAITAQRPKRGGPEVDGISGRVRMVGTLAPATMDNLAHRPGSAGAVASRIRAIQEQYATGVQRGQVEEVETSVEVRPSYPGIAGVLLGLGALVAALLG